MIKGFIFDLDGVIVDTAKYHYLAWKSLANALGFDLTEEENENLKGVSRMASLEYILKLGNVELSDSEKNKFAYSKNQQYLDLLEDLSTDDIMPGIHDLLLQIKKDGLGLALGSASKNSRPILTKLGIIDMFDFISDGNSTDKSKPDPEVFYIAAKGLNLDPKDCIVIEDSIKGLEAANVGKFMSIGVGDPSILTTSDKTYPTLENIALADIKNLYN